MNLSVIIEREGPASGKVANLAANLSNGDSGLASATDNSIETGKDVKKDLNAIIIQFEALNAEEKAPNAPKESTFVKKNTGVEKECDISRIDGDGGRGTLNSEGESGIFYNTV